MAGEGRYGNWYMCTRMVVTPFGLDVISQLRHEQIVESRHQTPTPPLKSILKARVSEVPSVSPPPPRTSRSASVSFRPERTHNLAKIQDRHQRIEAERTRIMGRIRRKIDAAKELNQHYEISFVNLDLPGVSPVKTRARFLQNLREEQDRKYAKEWTWLERRGFYRTKALSSRPS